MIEINLVPNVKQELLHAQTVRNTVISIATIAMMASVGAIVVLSLYVFGAQTLRDRQVNKDIEKHSQELKNIPDINKTLTIQEQLKQISTIHDGMHMNSRVFDVLTTITPTSGPNQVQYSDVSVDTTENKVTIQGQTPTYASLETFKKTIAATKFSFSTASADEDKAKPAETQEVNLASDISIASQSYAQDASGKNVVSFVMSFTYDENFMKPASRGATIVGPTQKNATDSFLGVPNSLFTQKATSGEEK